MNCRDDLLSLWGVCAVLFFAAICILHFLFCDRKNECVLPSGPGNMETVSICCQSAHQGKCSSLSVEFYGFHLPALIS